MDSRFAIQGDSTPSEGAVSAHASLGVELFELGNLQVCGHLTFGAIPGDRTLRVFPTGVDNALPEEHFLSFFHPGTR